MKTSLSFLGGRGGALNNQSKQSEQSIRAPLTKRAGKLFARARPDFPGFLLMQPETVSDNHVPVKMSHYFKRESDQRKQRNEDDSSSHTVVPIFNTKKKRIKQALYSNPSSSQETKTSFSSTTSQLNSRFSSNFTKNPASDEDKVGASFPRKPAAAQLKNSSANIQQRSTPFKPTPRKHGNNNSKNLLCLPKPRPQFVLGGTPLNSGNNGFEKKENMRNKTPANMNFPTQTPKKEIPKAFHNIVDRTAKVFTATVKMVMDWEEFREKITAVFEVYGAMESAVSTNPLGNGKSFILKDSTGNMRCTFWEMDRLLPRMTRGRSYRLVGSLDRSTKAFNCVSVRPANPVEVRLASTSTALSEMAMQSFITTFKED